MHENRMSAYRFVLYWAMLDIRRAAWWKIRWSQLWRPSYWKNEIRRIRYSGELADWLHNLALFSSINFERFDEEYFWSECDRYEKRYPEYQLSRYRQIFEQRLQELKKQDIPQHEKIGESATEDHSASWL
jgi:hypothetical protein